MFRKACRICFASAFASGAYQKVSFSSPFERRECRYHPRCTSLKAMNLPAGTGTSSATTSTSCFALPVVPSGLAQSASTPHCRRLPVAKRARPAARPLPQRGGGRPASGRRADVLVDAEEVGRVVKSLDRNEPVPRLPGVRVAHTRSSLVTKEIDVRAGIAVA